MKKMYLLPIAGMFLFQAVSAQSPIRAHKNHSVHKPATASAAHAASKTTAAQSRLMASVNYYGFNGSPLQLGDSSHCTYTGDRGYEDALGMWKFDSAKGWNYDVSNNSFTDAYRANQTFDNAGHIASFTSDEFDDQSNQWMPSDRERYTYTTAGMLKTYMYAYYDGSSSSWDSTLNTMTYNSAGKETESLSQDWDASSQQWVNSDRNVSTYNTSGLLDTMTYEYWDDNAGQWNKSSRNYNIYTGGKITTSIMQQYNGQTSTWRDMSRQTFTYDANGNMLVQENQSWDGSAWVNQSKTTNTYNSANDVTQSTYENYMNGSYQNSSRISYTYNSFRQVLTENDESWRSGQWVPEYQTHNYYELYFPASVADAPQAQNSMRIFPVPAINKLNLDIQLSGAETAAITIHDMTGNLVHYSSLPSVANYKGAIDVSNLPAGNYTVRLTGTAQPVMQKVTIVK